MMYIVTTFCCHCNVMLAKDLLSKLPSSKDTHHTVPVEHEATWFLKMGNY